jgi:hypothetical protein
VATSNRALKRWAWSPVNATSSAPDAAPKVSAPIQSPGRLFSRIESGTTPVTCKPANDPVLLPPLAASSGLDMKKV